MKQEREWLRSEKFVINGQRRGLKRKKREMWKHKSLCSFMKYHGRKKRPIWTVIAMRKLREQ